MVRVVQSKAPIVFEEVDGSLTVSEGGLILVPSDGWEGKSIWETSEEDGTGVNRK